MTEPRFRRGSEHPSLAVGGRYRLPLVGGVHREFSRGGSGDSIHEYLDAGRC